MLAKLRIAPVIYTKIIAFLEAAQLNNITFWMVIDSKGIILSLTDSSWTSLLDWVKHFIVPIV